MYIFTLYIAYIKQLLENAQSGNDTGNLSNETATKNLYATLLAEVLQCMHVCTLLCMAPTRLRLRANAANDETRMGWWEGGGSTWRAASRRG